MNLQNVRWKSSENGFHRTCLNSAGSVERAFCLKLALYGHSESGVALRVWQSGREDLSAPLARRFEQGGPRAGAFPGRKRSGFHL